MHEMTELDGFQECIDKSRQAPVLLYKHSTACPISGAAYRQVAEYESQREPGDPEVYMVKVIESRPVSNAIAETLGVMHKSPQLLLLEDGRAVWTTSHHNVRVENIRNAIKEHGSTTH